MAIRNKRSTHEYLLGLSGDGRYRRPLVLAVEVGILVALAMMLSLFLLPP